MSEILSGVETPSPEGDQSLGRAVAVAMVLWVAGPVVGNLIGAIPIAVVAVQQGGVPESPPMWALLTGQVLVDGTFLVVGFTYAKRWLGSIDWSVPDTSEWRVTLAGIGGAAVIWFGTYALSQLLSIDIPTSVITATVTETWALVVFSVLTVTVIPMAEEALFRGAIQRRLRPVVGRWPAIILATLAFLSIHLLNYIGGSLLGLAIAFGTLVSVSIVLGYIYDRTQNLAVSICAHAGYNALLIVVALPNLLG